MFYGADLALSFLSGVIHLVGCSVRMITLKTQIFNVLIRSVYQQSLFGATIRK